MFPKSKLNWIKNFCIAFYKEKPDIFLLVFNIQRSNILRKNNKIFSAIPYATHFVICSHFPYYTDPGFSRENSKRIMSGEIHNQM